MLVLKCSLVDNNTSQSYYPNNVSFGIKKPRRRPLSAKDKDFIGSLFVELRYADKRLKEAMAELDTAIAGGAVNSHILGNLNIKIGGWAGEVASKRELILRILTGG